MVIERGEREVVCGDREEGERGGVGSTVKWERRENSGTV